MTPRLVRLGTACATQPRVPEREDPSTCLGVKGLWDQRGRVMNEPLLPDTKRFQLINGVLDIWDRLHNCIWTV